MVTNAWMKCYELIYDYGLITEDTNTVFCNAELPGGFIAAVNHYMKTNFINKEYKWYGSSLVIGDSKENKINALGDQYGLWENNKDNWLMDFEGPNNGDATILSNIID